MLEANHPLREPPSLTCCAVTAPSHPLRRKVPRAWSGEVRAVSAACFILVRDASPVGGQGAQEQPHCWHVPRLMLGWLHANHKASATCMPLTQACSDGHLALDEHAVPGHLILGVCQRPQQSQCILDLQSPGTTSLTRHG
jgi:hypothetical protein